MTHFYQKTRGVRSLGSVALSLCYLANGSADGIYEYATYPWDTIAGVVIAEATGAKLTDEQGDLYTTEFDTEGRKCLVGSNGPLHEQLLDHLRTCNELMLDEI